MTDIASKIYSSRLLVHQAARALDNNDHNKITLAALAKKCNLFLKLKFIKIFRFNKVNN